MIIELALVNPRKLPPEFLEIDLPAIPRIGECLIFGGSENYSVKDVIFRFDASKTTLERITVQALSLGGDED